MEIKPTSVSIFIPVIGGYEHKVYTQGVDGVKKIIDESSNAMPCISIQFTTGEIRTFKGLAFYRSTYFKDLNDNNDIPEKPKHHVPIF